MAVVAAAVLAVIAVTVAVVVVVLFLFSFLFLPGFLLHLVEVGPGPCLGIVRLALDPRLAAALGDAQVLGDIGQPRSDDRGHVLGLPVVGVAVELDLDRVVDRPVGVPLGALRDELP